MHVRVPDRSTSKLYTTTPRVEGLKRLAVNGEPVTPEIVKGYAVITRRWEKGDTIEVELPMEVQRIKADPRIKADTNLLALQYGPLLYNVETADQRSLDLALSNDPLKAEWRPDLLGGVMVITGEWQDGTPMLAVPNYARMNRLTQERPEVAGDASVNYAPGATNNNKASASPGGSFQGAATPPNSAPRHHYQRRIESQVWMQSLA